MIGVLDALKRGKHLGSAVIITPEKLFKSIVYTWVGGIRESTYFV